MRRIDLEKAQAARSSTIRDINRQIVLNYVREREPISRAQIARATALQRSTVSTIVEELKAEGLIEDIGAGVSTGGRRPTLLRLRAEGAFAIGVDITPSATTIAASDLGGRVFRCESFPNSPRGEELLRRVVQSVEAMAVECRPEKVAGVGVSLPGLVDPVTGKAIYIPWFKWRDWPVAEEIAARTGFDVVVDNDANAAALAALWFGRPEVSSARDFIMVLVADGIGTGIIFDGQIYRGERGAAGEFGHMIVGARAPVACSCGSYECWEAFSSERAAIARYLHLTKREEGSIEFLELIDRALDGEAAAIEALAETAHYLGIGISNLIVGLSPATVVVGGRIARAWPLIGEAIGEATQRSVRRGLSPTLILPSVLGDQPTLLGATTLVLSRKFGLA